MIGLMLMTSVAFADVGEDALRLIRGGRLGPAVQLTSRYLDRFPDDPDAMCMLGVAWERRGHSADALGALSLAGGGAMYEDYGIDSHANSMRLHGTGQAAAQLRHGHLLARALPEGKTVRVSLALAEDYLSIGDPYSAEYWALAALSIHPNAPLVHAALAEIALYENDYEAADYYIGHGGMLGPTARGVVVAARRALILDDVGGAHQILEDGRELQSTSVGMAVLRLKVAHLQGEITRRDQMLTSGRWKDVESADFMDLRLLIAMDTGDITRAQELLGRALSLYPQDPRFDLWAALLAAITGPHSPASD